MMMYICEAVVVEMRSCLWPNYRSSFASETRLTIMARVSESYGSANIQLAHGDLIGPGMRYSGK